MEVLEWVYKSIKLSDIVFAKDRNGNWLHKKWCCLQYYDKIDGCPRFDKCENEKLLLEIAEEPFFIIGAKCNYKKYLEDMRERFWDWSDRKLRIPYLWETRINNLIEKRCFNFIKDAERNKIFDLFYMNRPEIHGVFVIATMLRLGYEIELKPKNIVWKIYLIGKRKGGLIEKSLLEYI